MPQTPLDDEQVIKKSRFITHIQRCENTAQAKACIANIKTQYPDARHHCWAYIAGHPTTSIHIACSDDGEPSGTAGKPILNVLQHRGIGEIVLVVVRYFGGIKLGAGGLVRAYSSSASHAMDKLEVMTLVEQRSFTIIFDYGLERNIKHLLETHNISIQQANYSSRVSLSIDVPITDIESFNKQLINMSAGSVSLIPR
ncbi:MAG: YigZ family protein [Ghiorsea sp.]|nr:YigZ family protein [Ghiorsea sp.]